MEQGRLWRRAVGGAEPPAVQCEQRVVALAGRGPAPTPALPPPNPQEDEEDEEAEEEGGGGAGVRTGGMDVEAGEEAADDGILVQEIDAYWLQRRISKAFGDIDPTAAQKLAEDTFAALQVRWGAGGCWRRGVLAAAGQGHVGKPGGAAGGAWAHAHSPLPAPPLLPAAAGRP